MIQFEKRFLRIAILVLLLVLFGCTNETATVGGGGVETTNNIIDFRVVYPDGEPASAILVRVRPSDFRASGNDTNSTKVQDFQTDKQGQVEIELVDNGEYTIEMNNNNSHASMLQLNIGSHKLDTTLADQIVYKYAEVSGIIHSSIENREDLLVQINGLDRVVEVNSLGEFSFTDLPEGEYNLEVVSSQNREVITLADVNAVSGESSDIIVNEDGFTYQKDIIINTTETGGNITEDLYNFPLLVKLDSTNFDFITTGDQEKISFVKNDGSPLVHEIEFWDEHTKSATIWVEIDTIHALATTEIKIQWGSTMNTEKSELLFSTEKGYSGVWHLNSVDNMNSSGNLNHSGENFDCRETAGVIGNAFLFENQSYATLEPEVFEELQNEVTISLWQHGTNADSLGNMTIFDARATAEADTSFLKVHLPWRLGSDEASLINRIYWVAGDSVSTGLVTTNAIYKDAQVQEYQGQWNHWSFTKNSISGHMKMFLNGELWHSDTGHYSSMEGIGIFKFGDINTHEDFSYNYEGYLDEFRVSHIERSASWIKMSYENQRSGSNVVKIGE